jgi:hypothetical protein
MHFFAGFFYEIEDGIVFFKIDGKATIAAMY